MDCNASPCNNGRHSKQRMRLRSHGYTWIRNTEKTRHGGGQRAAHLDTNTNTAINTNTATTTAAAAATTTTTIDNNTNNCK